MTRSTEPGAVHTRNCHLCEAGCGLEVRADDLGVVSIKADRDDVVSRGHICPKGALMGVVEADPDRITQPHMRKGGHLVPCTWEEAFDVIETRLRGVLDQHGRDAIATYVGNPSSHNLAATLYFPQFTRLLKSKNRFSAGSVDAWPQQIAALLTFGHHGNLLIPDLDRTDHLVIIGANPVVSNGSLATAPGWPRKLAAIQSRGGRVTVVDPRRTETARLADDHQFITPGTDAYLLLAVIETLFREDLVTLGAADGLVTNLTAVQEFAAPFTADAVAPICGIDADWIRDLSRSLARTPRSALYGRIGISLQELALVSAWAMNVVNVLTGSLDRPGGAMFARPATGIGALRVPVGRSPAIGRWTSRVDGYSEVFGEIPSVTMINEMLTAGDGQIRALITHSGNPVLSIPGGHRLVPALKELDLLVCIDIYINETTRHADILLPSPGGLQRSFYAYVPQGFAVRSYAKFAAAYSCAEPGQLGDDEILLRLGAIVSKDKTDVATLRQQIMMKSIKAHTSDPESSLYGMDPDMLLAELWGTTDPERLLDLHLRTGPFGDAFGVRAGINLQSVAAAPHGVDFGPMIPLLPDIIRTAGGLIELLPKQLAAQSQTLHDRFRASLAGSTLRLIGRRQTQSNNSWMHNVAHLLHNRNRCTLLIHPADAKRRGIHHEDLVTVSSDAGSVRLPAELTSDVMPGVVCVPHGWGHQQARLRVASSAEGENINEVFSQERMDSGTGNAAPNGMPVMVTPIRGQFTSTDGDGS